MFEGIHALNDDLGGAHPEAFKIYLSARSNMMDGSETVFKGTWIRLTRRSVRDMNFRGSDVTTTFALWANVRRGEKLYISPYKYRANLILDTALPYEILRLWPVRSHPAASAPQGKRAASGDGADDRRLLAVRTH